MIIDTGYQRAMKGGIGSASITSPDGLIVAALVAVNVLGDVIDPATGRVVAGVRSMDGRGLADARTLFAGAFPGATPGGAPTLGVLAANRALTKAQATKVAQMAHDGLARTIYPIHTPDGDTIFALSTGIDRGPADVGRIGAWRPRGWPTRSSAPCERPRGCRATPPYAISNEQ